MKSVAREQNMALVLIAGMQPVRLRRLSAHRDEFFKDGASANPYHT